MRVNMELVSQLMANDKFTKGLYSAKEANTMVNANELENGVVRIRTTARTSGSKKSEKESVRDALNALLSEYISACGVTMDKDELLTLSHVGIVSREGACVTISVIYKGIGGLICSLGIMMTKNL